MNKLAIDLSLALLLALTLSVSACDSGGDGDLSDDPASSSEQAGEGQGTGSESSSTGGDVSCEPGTSSGCLCDSGYLGTKSCETSGTAYGSCVCETCTPDCAGLNCGGDGCGGTCGICFGDDICKAGICKFNTQCPAGGTGKLLGEQAKNVTFTGAHAVPLELHSMCGETKAVWITLVAGWCTACTQLAPTFQNIHQQFIEEDVEWLLLVGDDGNYNPADWSYAKQYHAAKGYPETWTYAADPAFQEILDAVQIADAEGSMYLPAHVVLGSDMSIQFISNLENSEMDAMVVLQGLL